MLQITSVLKQHVTTQRNLVSNIRSENKLRPTFIEISKMFTSKLTTANESQFVNVEAIERIADQFSVETQASLAEAQHEVAFMRTELSRVNEKFLDGFRKLDQKMVGCAEKSKRSLTHNRTLATKMFLQWRQRKLFNAWKEAEAVSKLRKLKLKRFFTRFLQKQQREKLVKWRKAVSPSQIEESRLQALEADTHQAQDLGSRCCDKIAEMQKK